MVVNLVDDPSFLEEKFKSRSFSDSLSGASISLEFLDLKISTCHGFPSLWISDEEMRALAVPFEFALILYGLGSLFDPPLHTDNVTSNGLRPSISCVLVELDVTKRYYEHVWVGSESLGFLQRVELEEFPAYCAHCKVLGHSKVDCHILNPSLANNHVPNVADLDKDVGDNIVSPAVPTVSGEVPLMEVGLSEKLLSQPSGVLVSLVADVDIGTTSPIVENLAPLSAGAVAVEPSFL
ncbi:hypothetical protein M5K25_009903 [Dendrobium thyrsiflorum]|uniref:DUF4283 domain-containing protein n=1 Tax=Dendrobium thyrsiflorum TaxID=117978 RepID=A0ABD0V6Q6_DENTH